MSQRVTNGRTERRGRIVRRELRDDVDVSESLSWTSVRRDLVRRWAWLVGLGLLIVAAPVA